MDEQPKRMRRPRKAKKHDDHHGGAWKVAYADLVTAMMALFLVLWLTSQADQQLKQSIAQYFRSPGVFDSTPGGVLGGAKKISKAPGDLTSKDEEQALFETATMLRKAFSTRPEFSKYKDQVKIEITEEGLRIDILDKAERVSFPSGKADLTTEAQSILAEIAHGICQLPNPVMIGGHTDKRLFPTGSTYTNWELSADRANAARRTLEVNCLGAEKIRRVIGYADTQLLVPADPFSPANRRISIIVMRINAPPGKGENKEIQEGASPKDAEGTSLGSESSAESKERRLAKTKLSADGVAIIGKPDEVPAGKNQLREKPPQR